MAGVTARCARPASPRRRASLGVIGDTPRGANRLPTILSAAGANYAVTVEPPGASPTVLPSGAPVFVAELSGSSTPSAPSLDPGRSHLSRALHASRLLDDIPEVIADAKFVVLVGRDARIAFDHGVLHFERAAHGVDHAPELDDRAVAGSRFTMRLRCTEMMGSMRSLRSALKRARMRSSSAPASRL